MNKSKRQKGFSLVELMIAITVGLAMMAGVMKIFINTKNNYRVQDEMSSVQENGRFAIDFIGKELRTGGFLGCASSKGVNPNTNNSSLSTDLSSMLNSGKTIRGYEFSAGDTLPSLIPANGTFTAMTAFTAPPIVGTDIIIIQRANDCGAYLSTAMATTASDVIVLPNSCSFATGDFMIISSCSNVDVFKTSNVTGTTIKHANPLAVVYPSSAQIYKYIGTAFYIAMGSDGRRALWRHIQGQDPQELVPGVENLQIIYGEDTDNDSVANRYVNANQVTAANWDKIVSIMLTLTVQTTSTNLKVDSSTGRIQRTYKTVVNVRNKSLANPVTAGQSPNG